MSVRKVFCEVTDFSGDKVGLTGHQAWCVVRIYERGVTGVSVALGAGMRANLDEREGVIVRQKGTARWWVISPRDVVSIRRLLAKADAA